MTAIQTKDFDPFAAFGVKLDLKSSVVEPMFLATAAVGLVEVPIADSERSLPGQLVRERLAGEESLMGVGALVALVHEREQATLERIFAQTGAAWIEALGTVYTGQLYGQYSSENEYVIVAARNSRGVWNLWFRWLDDPRTRTDYVGVLYGST